MKLITVPKKIDGGFEILERKGRGHPDTLSDALAEELSISFSLYTREKFGAILHHNFDKLSILGGCSQVSFGGGKITSPIRVILNGRATRSFGDEVIPVRDILENCVYDFFSKQFSSFIEKKDIRIIYEVSTSSSPGAVEGYIGEKLNPRHRWFAPKSLDDLPELHALNCNDTSVACYTPPVTILSKHVLEIENLIQSSPVNTDKRVGTDMKIMGVRYDKNIALTVAIPLMASRIKSITDFFDTINSIKEYLIKEFHNRYPGYKYELTINPLDNKTTGDVYLTHCGSCIESGDEGIVGRGNRLGGLIHVNRAVSLEGICGKNPIYHTGKVLAGAVYEITHEVSPNPVEETTLYLVGQRGRSLQKPWFAVLEGSKEYLELKRETFEKTAESVLTNLDKVTEKLLNRQIPLY